MKAIIISAEEFLANTAGIKSQIGDEIVSINTKETCSVGRYDGGNSENVPAYNFVGGNAWLEASKKFEVIELETRPELLALYNSVHNAHEDQFESESTFTFNHGHFPSKS